MAKLHPITIRKGKTLAFLLRWGTVPIVYRPITGITQAAPAVVTAPSHGLVSGWPAAIVSVRGMVEINAQRFPPGESEYRPATVLTADTVEFNDINAADYHAYKAGGYLQYNTPHSLSGYTGRLSVFDRRSAIKARLWAATTAYLAGQYVTIPADRSVLICSQSGTSGGSAPTGPGADGSCSWSEATGYAGCKELLRLAPGSGLTITDATKTIAVEFSAAMTAAIDWTRGEYECEMESAGGVVDLIAEGPVAIEEEGTA